MRKAGGSISKFALKEKCPSLFIESFHNKTDETFSRALTEGLILGSYQFRNYFTQEDDDNKTVLIERADILNGNENGIVQGIAVSQSVCLARDLGNHPANLCTPQYLADQAILISIRDNLKAIIFDVKDFQKMKLNIVKKKGTRYLFMLKDLLLKRL